MKLLLVSHHPLDLWTIPAWFSERLRQNFPGTEVVHLDGYAELNAQLPDTEALMTWSLRPEQFTLARKLRWIHSPAAAVHQLMFPELINSDVILTNAREVHGPVVAEHVMGLIFALAKRIPQAVRLQLQHVWGQGAMWESHPPPRELSGTTLGLVGLGSIGREVARRAAGLGMRVIAVREHPEKGSPENVAQVYSRAKLDAMLSQSDYVVLAAPTTPATRGLINAQRLAAMKADAYLINVGRGPLIDEGALIEALRGHKIAGAALDVFVEEPLPANSPLWDLDNLLITPHTAGLTEKLWERHYTLMSENLRRYLAGQPLLGLVNKQEGY
jgi:phosphoglycerate dehydrogenase-like enzyme